jgi:hypothetical protein
MRIWCIKISIVLILHFNPESMPLLVDCKSPRVSTAQYLRTSVLALKYKYRLNCHKKVKFYKFISKERIIPLMHSSNLQRIWLNFMALWFVSAFSQFSFFPRIFNVFDLSITVETLFVEMRIWLVHQNRYRIIFAF